MRFSKMQLGSQPFAAINMYDACLHTIYDTANNDVRWIGQATWSYWSHQRHRNEHHSLNL
jgi:hypothetical protein